MDVTLANIRREYRTRRTLWVEVIGASASFLAALDLARRVYLGSRSAPATVLGGLAVLAVGWLLSAAAARLVRRTSFEAELWRKFALDRSLLDRCAALPDLDEATAETLDRALRDLRSLAAVRNHAVWDRDEAPDPGDIVELAEGALAGALSDSSGLAAVAGAIEEVKELQRLVLAALLRDEQDTAAELWREFEPARERLRELASRADRRVEAHNHPGD